MKELVVEDFGTFLLEFRFGWS